MRVSTWNLERGTRVAASRAQKLALGRVGADVVVLTEPPLGVLAEPRVVASPAKREGKLGAEAWVAINSNVEPLQPEVPYERTAATARITSTAVPIIVYGAVLPWLSVGVTRPRS